MAPLPIRAPAQPNPPIVQAPQPTVPQVIDQIVADLTPLYPTVAGVFQQRGLPVPAQAVLEQQIRTELQNMANGLPAAQQVQGMIGVRDALRRQINTPGFHQNIKDSMNRIIDAIQNIPNGMPGPGNGPAPNNIVQNNLLQRLTAQSLVAMANPSSGRAESTALIAQAPVFPANVSRAVEAAL